MKSCPKDRSVTEGNLRERENVLDVPVKSACSLCELELCGKQARQAVGFGRGGLVVLCVLVLLLLLAEWDTCGTQPCCVLSSSGAEYYIALASLTGEAMCSRRTLDYIQPGRETCAATIWRRTSARQISWLIVLSTSSVRIASTPRIILSAGRSRQSDSL